MLSGILGLGLRLWQRRVSFDPETLLFLSGCPAPALLLALTAVVAAVLLVSLRRESPPKTAAEVLACPSTLYMTLMVAGALLMLVGGALSVQEGLYQLTVWRVDPAAEPVTYPIALLLCALFSFLSGPGPAHAGTGELSGPHHPKSRSLVPGPARRRVWPGCLPHTCTTAPTRCSWTTGPPWRRWPF